MDVWPLERLQAVAFGSADAALFAGLGAALAATEQWEEAAAALRQAIFNKPAFAEAHNELGRVLALQGKTREAIRHFEEALRLKPDFAAAQVNLRVAPSVRDRK